MAKRKKSTSIYMRQNGKICPGTHFKKMRYFISTVFFQRSELKIKIRIRNTAEQIVSESYSSGIRIFSFEVGEKGREQRELPFYLLVHTKGDDRAPLTEDSSARNTPVRKR